MFFFLTFFLTLFLQHAAKASSLSVNFPVLDGVGPGTSPASFVNYVVVLAFVFVGAAAIIALVGGGIRYLVAAGSPEKEADAKDRIKSALLGLIFVIASIAILYTINPDFVRLRNPAIPLIRLPEIVHREPVPQGSCELISAAWSVNQSCFNQVSNGYDQVIMAVQGINCEGWGVSLNITDESGQQINQYPSTSTFDSNFLQLSWQPTAPGTYRFKAIAGSENVETTKTSGELLVPEPDTPCITTGPFCYASAAQPCFGLSYRCDPGVTDQLAKQEDSSQLHTFLQKMASWLEKNNKLAPLRISAISDNSGGVCFEPDWGDGFAQCGDTCNRDGTPIYKDAENTVRCCGHDPKSCHFGGTSCRGKSYAVDFGEENRCELIKEAQIAADPNAWFSIESDHIHISIGAEYGCGCDEIGGCVLSGSTYTYVGDQCSPSSQKGCDLEGNIIDL